MEPHGIRQDVEKKKSNDFKQQIVCILCFCQTPNFQICKDSTCLFITVLATSTTKKRYSPWKICWFSGGGGGVISLPTLADLRLKSLELPSRSALAAKLRAERIQRATLARQKQLQRLVWGTRAEKNWQKQPVEKIYSWVLRGKWWYDYWFSWPKMTKSKNCFWRKCPWLIWLHQNLIHSIADNWRWQLKFPMSLFSKLSANNLYTLDTVDFPQPIS